MDINPLGHLPASVLDDMSASEHLAYLAALEEEPPPPPWWAALLLAART